MATRANMRARGDRAPGPAPTQVYKPGDVLRYRTAKPATVAAVLAAEPTVFTLEAVAEVETLHGCRVLYLIACGAWQKWVTPVNLVRVEPEYPSGFVTVPPPAPEPEPQKADGAPEYAAAQKAAVDEVAKFCGMPAKVVQPPEAGDALADAEYTVVADLVWRGAGHNGLQTGDGRFAVALSGGLYTAHDHWTGESSGKHAVLGSAQQWCERRHRDGGLRLEWRKDDCGILDGLTPSGSRFLEVSTSEGKFLGVDLRVPVGKPERYSPWLATVDEAKRWCEVRAACTVAADGALRWVSLIPF